MNDRSADSSAPSASANGNPLAHAHTAFRAARFGEAEKLCLDVLSGAPDNVEALRLQSLIAARQSKFAQAIAWAEQSLAIAPDDAVSLANLSELYRQANRLDDALATARRLCGLQSSAAYLVHLGQVLVDRGDLDDALRCFVDALSSEPAHATAHLAIAQVLLARGEFRSGWFAYEWRALLPDARGKLPQIRAPQWTGMPLPKGRILLLDDQGFGDMIFFARYIAAVAERCHQVVLACSQALRPLLARIPGVWTCVDNWRDCPEFTAYARLSSLPHVFGTELHTIPAKIPYLTPDPDKVAHWRKRLNENFSAGLKVGVFWSGHLDHPNNVRRSLRLAQLAPLFGIAGVQFVSLQKDVPPQEIDAIRTIESLVQLGDALADFDDTAAVISSLDYVVTVDSAVAHLAGALGAQVGLMIAQPSDWRWLLERTDSPWYPTVQLYRQPAPGDWESVIGRIAADLAERAAARARSRS
jgi:tetratricopeptide (TPR) repeat protein